MCAGVYWSRALGSAVGIGLAPAAAWSGEDSAIPETLARQLAPDVTPDLIESVRERNIAGRLWELPGLERDEFPG